LLRRSAPRNDNSLAVIASEAKQSRSGLVYPEAAASSARFGAPDAARAMPTEWDIVTGHSIGSHLEPTPPKPIIERIARESLLNLVRRFDALVDEAIRDQKWIACLGD